MQKISKALSFAVLCSGLWVTSVLADDKSTTTKIAALSDFSAKLDVLEQAVDDVTVTGALALLSREYPTWEFKSSSGFGDVRTGTTNDLGAVASGHEYGMGKLRGAIFRNKHVSDEQREVGLRLLAQVKELILVSYELEKLVEAGDRDMAGRLFREQILIQSDKLNDEIDELTKDIEQAIKFSAL